jgi:hypothetical protein
MYAGYAKFSVLLCVCLFQPELNVFYLNTGVNENSTIHVCYRTVQHGMKYSRAPVYTFSVSVFHRSPKNKLEN